MAADKSASVSAPAVELRHITKAFAGVVANRDVSIYAAPGEIHGLIGENGAGKSTLMAILSGLYRPDAGAVMLDGREQHFHGPRDALAAGVGIVHQHVELVPDLTVAQNVILGSRQHRGWRALGRAERDVAALSERYRLPVDPRRRVIDLEPTEQQRVEILGALHAQSRVVVFDEPTALLPPGDTERLYVTIRQLAAEGRSIFFVSHKLSEVLALCGRISVMRHGEIVASVDRSEADVAMLARLMVGRAIRPRKRQPAEHVGSEPTLQVVGATIPNTPEQARLERVDLEVHPGEIVGIAGVEGSGQLELVEAITGLRRLKAGSILLGGAPIDELGVHARNRIGIGYIPDDPRRRGLVLAKSVQWNFALRHYRNAQHRWLLDRRGLQALTNQAIVDFDIRGARPDTPVGQLSGGNQHKIVVARELSAQPRLLIAVAPTVGLDIGAEQFVHEMLLKHRDRGAAVLLVSPDLDEIELLSDRIGVMHHGRLMEIRAAAAMPRLRVGMLMGGVLDQGDVL